MRDQAGSPEFWSNTYFVTFSLMTKSALPSRYGTHGTTSP